MAEREERPNKGGIPVWQDDTMLELYIHIPFCVRKCLYCDFLSFPAGEDVRKRYVDRLEEEIDAMGKLFSAGRRVNSVFLGGGTPSLLEPELTGRIMGALRRSFRFSEEAEVTTEANPGTLTGEKLRSYHVLGINRLSLGLQSADRGELKSLGRIHDWEDFLESYRLAREAGFTNINVDLMSALPGQTMASYRRTLEAVTELSPEHISAYSLIIEEGTPFCERYARDGQANGKGEGGDEVADAYPPLPDEDAEREMYYATKEILMGRGYERYEISNYARPGYACRHNIGYWTGAPYLGLGLGASSYLDGERFVNERGLERYFCFSGEDFRARNHHLERHVLTSREKMEEYMFLGLRLAEGISEDAFAERFGISLAQAYGPAVERLIREGLMERFFMYGQSGMATRGVCIPSRGAAPPQSVENYLEERAERGKKPAGYRETNAGDKTAHARLRLTDRGIDVSNHVLCNFLLD